MQEKKEKVEKKMEADQEAGKTVDRAKLHEEIFVGKFKHKDQIDDRFSLLKQICLSSTLHLSKDNLNSLWTILVDQSLFKYDSKLLFQLLNESLT